jgi:hypothetical protein
VVRTSDVLRKRRVGVTEEEFAALLDDALDAVQAGHAPDPRRVLTASETAALTAGGADLAAGSPVEPGPGAEAAAALGALLASSLTVAGAAARLGVDPSRIRHRLLEGSLYGIRLRGGWRLPAFQFTGGDGLVPGVPEVLAAIPRDLHPLAVQRWLTTPSPDLLVDDSAMSPLAWLESGGAPDPVATLAAAL